MRGLVKIGEREKEGGEGGLAVKSLPSKGVSFHQILAEFLVVGFGPYTNYP